jgi:hypothetical protein
LRRNWPDTSARSLFFIVNVDSVAFASKLHGWHKSFATLGAQGWEKNERGITDWLQKNGKSNRRLAVFYPCQVLNIVVG